MYLVLHTDCKLKMKGLPCNFGLTGRVHEEECDRTFSVLLLSNKEWSLCLFFNKLKKRMERREMIKRKIANLEKALEKVIFKNDEDCLVVFYIGKDLGSLIFYSTTYLY